jgi:hypothetical protein
MKGPAIPLVSEWTVVLDYLRKGWTDDGCALVSTVAAVASGFSVARSGGLGL